MAKKIPYKRGSRWVGPIRVAGEQRWVGSFDTKADWEDAAAKLRVEIKAEGPRSEQTIGTYVEQLWLQLNPRPKPTSDEKLRGDIRPLVRKFGHVKFDKLDKLEARTWMSSQTRGTITACRAMWNNALKDGAATRDNPFARPGIRESRGRADIQVLSDDELALLLDTIEELHPTPYGKHLRALVATAALTAARPGELYALEWGDLRLEELEAVIRRRFDGRGRLDYPKTHESYRTIVVPPAARDAILAMPRIHDRYVFTSVGGKTFQKSLWTYYWHPIRAAFMAKLPDHHWLRRRVELDPKDQLDFYELRHYGCTRFLELGASAEDVAVQLGHRGPELVYRLYGHPSKARARDRLKMLDAKLTDSDLQQLTNG